MTPVLQALQRAGWQAARVPVRWAHPHAGTARAWGVPRGTPLLRAVGGGPSPLQQPVAPVAPPADGVGVPGSSSAPPLAAQHAQQAAGAPLRASRVVPRAAGDDAAIPSAGGLPEGGGAGRAQAPGAAAASAAREAVEAAARALAAPYQAYGRALERRPLLTKACTRCAPCGAQGEGRRPKPLARRAVSNRHPSPLRLCPRAP
jgi:hypothetical protein